MKIDLKNGNYKMVVSPEISKELQEKFYTVGGTSKQGDRDVKHTLLPYIYIENFTLLRGSILSIFLEDSDQEIKATQMLDALDKLIKEKNGKKNVLKWKPGNKVLVKSWKEIKKMGVISSNYASVEFPGGYGFLRRMKKLCGKIVTINTADAKFMNTYQLNEDKNGDSWIECILKEIPKDLKYCDKCNTILS